MALSGSLLDFGVTDVLQLISMQGKDGVLAINARGQQVSLAFTNGNLVFAEHTHNPLVPSVAAQMVRDGVVSQSHSERAFKAHVGGKKAYDQALADQSGIDSAQVIRYGAEHVRKVVFSLFDWVEGDYTFDGDARLPDPFSVPIPGVQVSDILMEAAHREHQWPQLQERAGGPRTLYTLAPDLDPDTAGVSPDQAYLLRLVDGVRDRAQLEADSRFDGFETIRLLVALQDLGAVQTTGESAPVADVTPKAKVTATGPAAVRKPLVPALVVGAMCLGAVSVCGWLLYTVPAVSSERDNTGLAAWATSFRDHKVRQALTVYRLMYGNYPKALAELASEGLTDEATLRGMLYVREENRYRLQSG